MEEALKALLLRDISDQEVHIDRCVELERSSAKNQCNQAENFHNKCDWEQELASRPELLCAEGWQHFLAMKIEKETAMKVQWRHQMGDHMHMAKALKKAGLVEHSHYYFSKESNIVHGVFSFSKESVSHPAFVHGGAQFFVLDECCGQLAFLVLPGGALTAQCETKFIRPLPASLPKCIVTAEVEIIEGRKALLRGSLRESPNGPIYTQLKALYVKAPDKLMSAL